MRNGYCPTTVIILSRESDHAFDQGFSDQDSVVDAVLTMARSELRICLSACRGCRGRRQRVVRLKPARAHRGAVVLCFQMLDSGRLDLETS